MRAAARDGYTLVEILIVLALLGLLSAIALPRLYTLFDVTRDSYRREDLLSQVAALGYRAWVDAKPYTLDADSLAARALPLEVPDGWQLSAEPPIRFSSDGLCTGGVLSLQDGPRIYRWQLDPPLCRPREYRR